MKLEKDIPQDLDVPGVPDLLRTHLMRKLRGPCKRVKIEVMTDERTGSLLNAIKLADRGAVNNAPDLDEVSSLVTSVMYASHLERSGTPDYTAKYRVTVEMRNDKGKTPYSERSFIMRYAPGEDDDGGTQELLRENGILDEALSMQRELVNQYASQNSELFEKLLTMAGMMVEPIRASADMHHNATMMWTNGANLLVEGHKAMFNIESVNAVERAKTDRINAMLAKFGGPLADLSMGLIGTVLKKFGAPNPIAAAAKQAGAASSEEPAQAEDAPEAEQEEPDPEEHRILAHMADGFAMTLTSKQRKLLRENLTKTQLDALENVFCAEDNDAIVRLWPIAYDKMGMEKIMWMAGILSAEQQSDFMKIKNIIERHIARVKSEGEKK